VDGVGMLCAGSLVFTAVPERQLIKGLDFRIPPRLTANQGPFHQIFEFTDISRPSVILEMIYGGGGDCRYSADFKLP